MYFGELSTGETDGLWSCDYLKGALHSSAVTEAEGIAIHPYQDSSESAYRHADFLARAYNFARSRGVALFSYYHLLKLTNPWTVNWDTGIINVDDSPTLSATALRSVTGTQSPTAVTSSATAITSTRATLNGSVNPNGITTRTWFEYGTTTAYGNTTTVGIGAGTGAVPHSADISGLRPNTTYHYRIVARSRAGTRTSADQTFTTPGRVWNAYDITS